MIGVVKAYSTRVGGGPFPTEQDNEIGPAHSRPGKRIRHGHAAAAALRLVRRGGGPLYGPAQRRRYAGGHAAGRARASCRRSKICTAYEIDGRRVTHFPSHVDDLRRAVPVYETLPGWRARHQRRAADGRFAGRRPGPIWTG